MKKLSLLLLFILFMSSNTIHAMEYQMKVVLFPINTAMISAGVDSVLMTHYFKEGETFDRGNLLVKFDDRRYKQAVIIEKQNLAEETKQFQYAKKEMQRIQKLHQSKMAGNHELEQAKLKREVAAIRQLRSEAKLKLAQYRLDKCSIKAPFSGRLTTKDAKEHEFVRAGQPIISIIDDHQLLAVMHVPSQYRPQIALDMKITVRIDETATEYHGSVYSIGAVIEPGSRTFEVKVLIENQDLVLSGGMSGLVISEIGTRE